MDEQAKKLSDKKDSSKNKTEPPEKRSTLPDVERRPGFESAHEVFLRHHLDLRFGERRGRLERGHQYAEKLFLEKVWWPLFGNFEHLHPEYEIYDWNRRSQFLDFAFLPANGGLIGIECDGFQSHIKDMDREKFSYALNRDTFLTGMGWKMLHFAFDDIRHRPEVCRMLLQMSVMPMLVEASASGVKRASQIGSRTDATPKNTKLTPMQKDVLKLAWRLGRAIRPKDVTEKYGINFRTARTHLNSLVEQGWISPVGGGKYVRYYEIVGGFPPFLLE